MDKNFGTRWGVHLLPNGSHPMAHVPRGEALSNSEESDTLPFVGR